MENLYHDMLLSCLPRWYGEKGKVYTSVEPVDNSFCVEYGLRLQTILQPTLKEFIEDQKHKDRRKMLKTRRKPHFSTEEEKVAAMERVKKGERLGCIADDLGVDEMTVYTWCKKRGVPTPNAIQTLKARWQVTPAIDQHLRSFLQQYPRANLGQIMDSLNDQTASLNKVSQYIATHQLRPYQRQWMQRMCPLDKPPPRRRGRKKQDRPTSSVKKKRGRPVRIK